ncbi:uncharacterized protein LOC127450830 isoform X1 [Myxocyprinus asiaticus]|uniref:uncharacterized protein LOC127450830 isoform X1 n=1 Tax=Myxocyprinus asiaticus TaxID=70543 RepID=UPI00222142E7|nr:uncharacterized protein LOC127450830 isoform X1 [Myxocyprinus asiaticus]
MMDVMNTVDFQTQLTSIMEMLAKTAIVEIGKLFEENSSFVRLEISRCTNQIESLQQKCHLLENELQSARKTASEKMMNGTDAAFTHSPLTETEHRPAINNVFGKEWCMNMWRHEESNVGQKEERHVDSSVITGESPNFMDDELGMTTIKEEACEDFSVKDKTEEDQSNSLREMQVQVEYEGNLKWVRIPMKNDCYDYYQFVQEASTKFNLPNGTNLVLKDSGEVEVDSDIFDELVRSSKHLSFKVFSGDKSAERELTFSSVESESSSSTVIPQPTKAHRRKQLEAPPDCNRSRDLVYAALRTKPGGSDILKEYNQTKRLSDQTRRKLVNILVADMVESHGRVPPVNMRITYALGIVTLFPNLKDKCSPTGYEQYYDSLSGKGYLAYRLKTVQRNSGNSLKRTSKSVYQDGPKTLRVTSLTAEQLSDDKCREAVSMMKHSTDQAIVKERMKATFEYRRNMMHDPDKSSLILDFFPRFLDTPGLIDQDFTILFGEDISGKFITNWPTFYKPRIITDCKNLRSGAHVDNLLSAQQDSDYGWDSDVAAILLLVHLLPPTVKGRKTGKISATEAADRVVKFMKVGMNIGKFLDQVGSSQPFLLCVGEKRSNIQKFYIILDQKAIPCMTQTAVAAFDELFKAHFVFAVSYDEALCNFYTFIQTTVYGIDVGTTKESPRVKEIRVRFHNT